MFVLFVFEFMAVKQLTVKLVLNVLGKLLSPFCLYNFIKSDK